MANTLTALAPTLFSAAKKVANEPAAAISAINMSFDNKGVAIGDYVTVPIAPTRSVSAYTPSMTTTAGADATATSVDVAITANNHVSWQLSGEQSRSLDNGGINQEWVGQLVSQGMRSLRNAAEADALVAIKEGASRAYGTAGTTPFASDLSALTNARKILVDNGAPLADMSCIYDSAAGLNLSNLGIVQQAYQAGSDAERRSGNLGRQFGFNLATSGGIATHTKGTGSGYLVNNASGYSVGDTAITVDTGTGTVLAGDIVTFAGDSNKYVVASALASNVVTLAEPGLRAALADNAAMTVGSNYVANVAFERSAVVGIVRPPLIPANANMSQLPISDSFGMSYLLVDIVGDGMRTWRLHLAHGFKAVNSAFAAVILG